MARADILFLMSESMKSGHLSHSNWTKLLLSLSVFVLFVCVGSLQAQPARSYPLLVEFDSETYSNRSGGPILLRMRVQCGLPAPGVSGDLTLELVNDASGRVGIYELDNLFFTSGTQDYEFLIQPPTARLWQSQYDVFVTFTSSDGIRHALNPQVIRTPGASRRACVVTLASPDSDRMTTEEKELCHEFFLETCLPDYDDQTQADRPVVSLSRLLEPIDFPNSPLEHCVSDLVIISSDLFAKLSEQQIIALKAWIRAGGSCLILLNSSQHVNSDELTALNSLGGFPESDPHVFQTPGGGFSFEDEEKILTCRSGFGRVAYVRTDPQEKVIESLTEQQRLKLFVHLWKVRKEQVAPILESGKWSWDPGRRYTVLNNWNFHTVDDPGIDAFVTRFRQTPSSGGASFLQRTQPTGMKVLPLWFISLSLFLYVLAIGPLDYLCLGSLGLRKWTWVTFPVMTVLFAFGAITTSNYAMQGSNEGGSLTIVDVTDDGQIARVNELHTMLLSTSRQLDLEADRELLTSIDLQSMSGSNNVQYRRPDETPNEIPFYRGSFPSGAHLIQAVHKWSPQVFRRMKIPTEDQTPPGDFDWTLPIDPAASNQHLALQERLREAFGDDVYAQLIRQIPIQQRNNTNWYPVDRIVFCGDSEFFDYSEVEKADQMRPMAVPVIDQYGHRSEANFLYSTAFRTEAGIYSVVSQLSPKCDDFLEDLPLIDSSDPHQWLLLVATKDDNHWTVYRKVYDTRTKR
ncbi:hypothetical protein KOR42_30230 [Thalassoglobus neptunius]|uniref:DUF4350 domain-containing protein n=1 Tax=Thalassoglobus neptunius TaxID=1938619 RepID=A0A5C5WP04_9PLAN|nr:hypothetical protein [Thalassoglobus neptunius]TWT52337.1 hypothetical protein KOR42_30230 [Thalassoglobus neptunius]